MPYWHVIDGKVVEEIPEDRVRVVEREHFLRYLQATGGRIATDVSGKLALPDDVKVVYIIEPDHDD